MALTQGSRQSIPQKLQIPCLYNLFSSMPYMCLHCGTHIFAIKRGKNLKDLHNSRTNKIKVFCWLSKSSTKSFTLKYQLLKWMNISLAIGNMFKYNNMVNDYYLLDSNGYYYFVNSDYAARDVSSMYFYPRKVGFLPKRLSMWYMLVVIKIWHHFMLFIWWFFFLLRLVSRRKNSYSLLSVCSFNVFCCYLLAVLIYMFQLLPLYENYFRIKPDIRWTFFNKSLALESLGYVFDLLTFKTGSYDIKTEFWLLVDYLYMLPRKEITDADMPSVFTVENYTSDQILELHFRTLRITRNSKL